MSKEYAFWAFEEQALRLPSTVCTRSSAKRAGNILCKHCLCLYPLSLLALVAPMGCSIAIFEDDILLKDQDQDKDQVILCKQCPMPLSLLVLLAPMNCRIAIFHDEIAQAPPCIDTLSLYVLCLLWCWGGWENGLKWFKWYKILCSKMI